MKQVHRRLLSLGVAVVGFLGLANFVGQEQEVLKVEAESESKDAKIYSFLSPLEIDGIELVNQHGRFELARVRDSAEEVGRWRLLTPKAFDADLLVVEGVLAQALPVRRRLTVPNPEERTLEERLEAYDLSSPQESLTLKSGDKRERVHFGMGNGFDKSIYVHLQETQEIVTVADSLRHQLGKSLFDLRDKQLIDFERSDVVSLEVGHRAKKLTFQLQGDRWKLLGDKGDAPVAEDRLQDLLQDLRALKFNRIVSEEQPSVGAEALATDQWNLVLGFLDGRRESLVLGLKLEDESEALVGYHKGSSGPVGELVRGRWPSLLKGGFMGLVDRRILPFDLEDADWIELRDGEETLKVSSDGEDSWKPRDQAFALDEARLKGLFHTMNSLEQLRIISVESSLDDAVRQRAISAQRSLRVMYQGETYTLHPQAGEEPNEMWVNGQVVQVDANRLADLLWTPMAYRAKPQVED